VIEGDDAVYFTSEHLTWRWSKGAHVSVNATVRYFVDGRKLHVLDEDGKEHTIEIEKTIRKIPPSNVATVPPQIEAAQPQAVASPTAQVSVTVDSIPAGADIEIDGAFVGNTPSTISLSPGSHNVSVKKRGFDEWKRNLNVTGGAIRLNAELTEATSK
jgi:hypothetical protein